MAKYKLCYNKSTNIKLQSGGMEIIMKKIAIVLLTCFVLIFCASCAGETDNAPFVPERLDIANMPTISHYTVGESDGLCLDGLAIMECPEMSWERIVCWSECDMKYDDRFCLAKDQNELEVTHNVDFDKCGEYTVTVEHKSGGVSVEFPVYVVEDKAQAIENSDDAILLAKRYVYSEYGKSFYEHNTFGPSRYSISAELENGVWTVFWSDETGLSELVTFGGGGPCVEINAETGEIVSCSLQQ